MKNLYRLAAAVPSLTPGNPAANAAAILALFQRSAADGAAVTVTPELAMTGRCGDLLGNRHLQAAVEDAVGRLAADAREIPGVLIVGVPLPVGDGVANAALVIRGGAVIGAVAKEPGPGDDGFTPASALPEGHLAYAGMTFPLYRSAVFSDGALVFGIAFEDEPWALVPRARRLAANGATAVLALATHPDGVGQNGARRRAVCGQSECLTAAYLAAGWDKTASGGETAYCGHALIAVDGGLTAETCDNSNALIATDLPVDWLKYRRRARRMTGLTDAAALPVIAMPPLPTVAGTGRLKPDPEPFVPVDEAARRECCAEVLRVQSVSLAQRLTACRSERMVLGISGGLDSTLALLACVETCRRLGWPTDRILAVTMPGFGTTGRTRGNAERLAEFWGAEVRVIPIHDAVKQHFRDIGHDETQYDVVYENSQARERTQILMDLANAVNGLVIGTGDLSEIALGWSTFNGDHMAMYSVNAGVPKTLIRPLLEHAAASSPENIAAILRDICATPVSPELLPGVQHTESILGHYEWHDFYLYHFLKYGGTPEELLELAVAAFGDRDDRADLEKAWATFCRRFISQQFKRNCAPEAPRILEISLNARSGWQMPSLMDGTLWR
ncbi:MAG: NAD(+) synthase [Lentisphaeria bacterium]|nr:NAD(+) synthase [Lentisphaeria bacterium]